MTHVQAKQCQNMWIKFEVWRVLTAQAVPKNVNMAGHVPSAGNLWCHLMSLIDQSCWSSKVDMEQATIGSLAWGHTVMTLMISSIMMVVGGDGCVMVCYSVQLARVRWCWKTYSWSKSYVKCIFFAKQILVHRHRRTPLVAWMWSCASLCRRTSTRSHLVWANLLGGGRL